MSEHKILTHHIRMALTNARAGTLDPTVIEELEGAADKLDATLEDLESRLALVETDLAELRDK